MSGVLSNQVESDLKKKICTSMDQSIEQEVFQIRNTLVREEFPNTEPIIFLNESAKPNQRLVTCRLKHLISSSSPPTPPHPPTRPPTHPPAPRPPHPCARLCLLLRLLLSWRAILILTARLVLDAKQNKTKQNKRNDTQQMGFIQPTTYALINVTDFPFFVVPLNEIEHVHFERVFSSSKTCDMKIIMKVLCRRVISYDSLTIFFVVLRSSMIRSVIRWSFAKNVAVLKK